MARELSALNYPFSRSISLDSLKQLLLVFDSVTFLDPVDDDAWRAKLYRDLESVEDKRFGRYRDVHTILPTLFSAGALVRRAPDEVRAIQLPATSAAAVSDLLDPDWVSVAANPQKFRMPYFANPTDGAPTWQIFQNKLPEALLTALHENASLRRHVIHTGDRFTSWTLTYEAGSAAALNVHLAAAEELELAPVTDSDMHNRLLLRKLARGFDHQSGKATPLSDELITQLTNHAAIRLVDEIVPADTLATVTFEDILKFRESTSQLRKQAVADISQRLALLSRVPSPEELLAASREVQGTLRKQLSSYRSELSAARDKLWPTMVGAFNTGLTPGSAATVAMSYIGGPGHALATSITAGALMLLKGFLDVRAEQKKVVGSAAPAVTYLSRLSAL